MKKLFVIVLLVVIAGAAVNYFSKPPKNSPQPITFKSETNNNIYTSTLGISFSYLPKQDSTVFTVKEMKDKVCVTIDVNDNDCSHGQWVQIFKKNPKDTLVEAIKKQFLSHYSPNDCFVTSTPPDPNQNVYPASYETAVISFPKTEGTDAPWWQNADKCPAIYTETNGIAYFLEDKTHPDKFLFFSIGQYAIMSAESGKPWNQTIKFL